MTLASGSKPYVFMFSGHGTQYYQMGIDYYSRYPVFKHWLDTQDQMIQRVGGYSVLEQLFHPANKKSYSFDSIRYTHPAIFMVQYALVQMLLQDGIEPDIVLGTSLGEYIALTVAGVIPLEEMLHLLVHQSEELSLGGPNGGMLSVLEHYETRFKEPALANHVELAALNYIGNFVVAGKHEELIHIETVLKSIYSCFRLPVKYAFHSSLMDKFEQTNMAYFRKMKLSVPNVAYYSCVYGRELIQPAQEYLWEVVRKPILFHDTIQKLEARGPLCYFDFSPTGTLSNFVTQIIGKDSDSEQFRLMNPYQERGKDYYAEFKSKMHKPQVYSGKVGKSMNAIVFPGQGSQRLGMGKDLFQEFKPMSELASGILGYSIEELCLKRPDLLDKTEYTQPAIYVVNALNYTKMIKEGESASMVAGHSLGEYNALQASGAISFEDGLRLVIKRSQLMAQVTGGGMAAIIGYTDVELKLLIAECELHGLDIANHNTPTQIVVAGPKEELEQLEEVISNSGKGRCVPLRVSGAFHSRYMSEASRLFNAHLEKVEWMQPNIPVIANVTAEPYEFKHIQRLLADQINHSVRWTESVQYMLSEGTTSFIEVGGKGILTSMIEEIKQEFKLHQSKSEVVSGAIEETAAAMHTASVSSTANIRTGHNRTEPLIYQGSTAFLEEYSLKHPYVCGGMHYGVSSSMLVVRAAKAGMMAFLGTSGLTLEQVSQSIDAVQQEVGGGYGMNITPSYMDSSMNDRLIDLFLQKGISCIEASGFIMMEQALVKYRIKGLKQGTNGTVLSEHKLMAKLSRPEIAAIYLSPAPQRIVDQLLVKGEISEEQAYLSRKIAMADDICIQADSAGMTDRGSSFVIFPSLLLMAEQYQATYGYAKPVRLGIGGGIGSPDAAATAFLLGAQFIVTGSINQCTVEASTSEISKQLLVSVNVQDTEIAPSGEMFELGAKVQVLKKGVFFPARANRLYESYKFYSSLEEMDPVLKNQIQHQYFGQSFEQIYRSIVSERPAELEQAERNPKYKMALIFRHYFRSSIQAALMGDPAQKVNYQIPCGSSMGTFNQWVNGTQLEDWRQRHVDAIGLKLMDEANWIMKKRLERFSLHSLHFSK
ncbi:ACP S-malonyltransferase [Paenibacillus sp. S150]|uniref:ACP S-malonyltransferase n=1 Tax=Paenibacillus sp. S150 TaxID=2749826 RepID=UPI001C5958F5|nr:ACP S-malonyltransferase [Paenibacillus sp. S150]MBW4084440.1 ACP S-malonyltransferase [Paenibacillus sp. S150]